MLHYGELVERVRSVLAEDARPACRAVRARLVRLVEQHRYEEAAVLRRRLESLLETAARFHRVSSLARCPEIVAARWAAPNWEIHIVRYGRLAGTGLARPGQVPQAVARTVLLTAETVSPPLAPAPAATIEETTRIADWLEQPGTRIIAITGDWAWPLHGVVTHAEFVEHALGGPDLEVAPTSANAADDLAATTAVGKPADTVLAGDATLG